MNKSTFRVHRLRMGAAIAALLLTLVAAGCLPLGRGAYPLDIFAEMHYTQMHKSQEPPRLYPAPGAVPFMAVGEGALVVPDVSPAKDAATVEKGEYLYAVNCVACHGIAGKGDGPMTGHLARVSTTPAPNPPADLTGDATVNSDDEALMNFIGGGGRIGYAFRLAGQSAQSKSSMPEFDRLMTEEERWTLVQYMRSTP